MNPQIEAVKAITIEAVEQFFNRRMNKIKRREMEKWFKEHYPELAVRLHEDNMTNRLDAFEALLLEAATNGRSKTAGMQPKALSLAVNMAGSQDYDRRKQGEIARQAKHQIALEEVRQCVIFAREEYRLKLLSEAA